MAVKETYAGKFNISRETITETADAYSSEQAKFIMSQKIAMRRGVFPQVVWQYLKQNPLSYEIRKVINAQHS